MRTFRWFSGSLQSSFWDSPLSDRRRIHPRSCRGHQAGQQATPDDRLTDIEADTDDTQSMVRLLLYSDVIDVKGLITATSTWKRTSVAPESFAP